MAMLPVATAGALAALTTAASVASAQLLKRRADNDQRRSEIAELESQNKIEKSIDAQIAHLTEIEEIRKSLTEDKARHAERFSDKAEHLSESLGEARTKIDFQLAKIKHNYSVLLQAGNVRELDDGTYEVVDLSALSNQQEQVARLAIERDNSYITKSNSAKNAIGRLTASLDRKRDELAATANSTAPELLERNGSPEILYQEALQEIAGTFEPRREEGTPRSSRRNRPGRDKNRPESGVKSSTESKKDTRKQLVESTLKTAFKSASKQAMKHVEEEYTDSSERGQDGMGMGE